jgi:acetylornithine deacetylase/succinyl-diaminopimelate desuccinylase-like protein
VNSEVAELTSRLVRIPSVNPDGDPGTDQVGEARIADFLGEFLTGLGAEVSLREVFPGRPNVVARFPADRPGKPRLLLAPHTDTVSVAGMTIDPFGGEILDGKVRGRGTTDTKGPMAAMLHALSTCSNKLPSLSHEIWFAGLMGEETGLHGSRALAASDHFDFVIAGEPTDLKTVATHKGSTRWVLKTTGRAVHSSTPDEGENAIDAAIDALTWLKARFADIARPHPTLGPPTLSVGIFRGGSKINIVPDQCHVEIDMRTTPDFPADELAASFQDQWPHIRLEIDGAPSLDTDLSHPLIQKLNALGAPPATAPWFCDAASFAAQGTPAIALGPGSIKQAHVADEWISIAALENGTDLFSRLLLSL